MTSFKYLGRVMIEGDDNWPSVSGNLWKSRKSWVRITRILSQEGTDPKVSRIFFKAAVQAVLLLRADTWVLTPRIKRALSILQHKVA